MFSQVSDWPILPGDLKLSMVSGIGCDSRGHIHVAHRGTRPLLSFDGDGRLHGTMGEAVIEQSVYYKLNRTPATALGRRYWIHGLSVDPWDNVWITDVGRHIVMKFSPDSKLALTMGVPDVSGESPTLFNQPTHVLVTPAGEIYVADGYGNSRVVKFSPKGEYLLSWGKCGTGPGEFQIPHCLTVDSRGRVYVADRGNDRVQVFDENGRFLLEWPNLHAIDAVHTAGDHVYAGLGTDNRILKLDRNGAVLDSWGSEQELGFPHGLCSDGEGNLYVAEILANRATKLRIKSDARVEQSLALSTKSRPA